MAVENSQAFNIESKKMVKTEQFESVCRFIVPMEKPIKKIVSVTGSPKILSSEKVGENISFSGITGYQVVYLTDEDKLTSVSFNQEWQQSVSYLGQEDYFISVNEQENVLSDYSQTEIVVTSLLNVEFYSIMKDTIAPINGLSEDFVSKQKDYIYNKVVNKITEHFTEVAEQEINQKIDEILFSNAEVIISNVAPGIDSVNFFGEIVVNAYALCDNKVEIFRKNIDFQQEVASLSVVPENVVDFNAVISLCKVTASATEDNKTNLIYSLEIGLDAVIYEEKSVSVIEDAFSLTKKTNLNVECLLKSNYLGYSLINNSLLANLETDRTIQKVLYVLKNSILIADINKTEEGNFASGAIEISVVCLDENNESFILKNCVPFSFAVENIGDVCKITGCVVVDSFKVRDKNLVELDLTVNLLIKGYNDEYLTFISEIEELNEREVNQEAITVYVVDSNEKLFDVAKNLLVKPEDILIQNNITEEDVKEGVRLVVYSTIDTKFNN